jgi:hypothetical protein
VETDASDETFSQASHYSETLEAEEASSAQHTVCAEEMELADSETPTCGPPKTGTTSYALHATGNEDASSSLHNPVFSSGTTQQMLKHSSGTVKQNGNRVNASKKHVNFAPSTRDPSLESASYGNQLLKSKTSLTSYICETITDSPSTYFSTECNLPQASAEQITSPSHKTVHESPSQMQSMDMFSTQGTSDLRQSPTELTVHSQLCMSKNVSSRCSICSTNISENVTHDLPDMMSVTCLNTSDNGKKQAKNPKLSSQSPADMWSSDSGEVLQVNNRTAWHTNQNWRQTECTSVIKNPDEILASSLDVRKCTTTSQNTIRKQTRHKVESRLQPLSNEGSQTVQNSSKPSVISIQGKQVENLQSLSTPQKFRSQHQCLDHCALTHNMTTQSEEESFIFGIKRIWIHSAQEFIPNCQLPEGFWTNKDTPIPEDLLQALENW